MAAAARDAFVSDAYFSAREQARRVGKTLAARRVVPQATARRSNPKKALRHCLPRR